MNINMLLLLAAVVVIISTTFLSKISKKIRVPALLAFIFLGMLFGSEGILKVDFSDFQLAEQVCTVALIFIMFYGGFGTNWKMIKPVFGKASIMASLGTVLTALLVGLFCHYVLKMEILEGFLLGAVISSTDAASVFSILKSEKLSLKYNTDSLLEMESGANDPFSYLLTVTVISMIQGQTSAVSVAQLLFSQLFFGIAFGGFISFLTVKIFKNFRFENEGFQSAFMVAIAIISYALPAAVGGNGFLSAYIVGVSLGNRLRINKKTMVHMFDGITSLMQIVIFFVLGLLSSPALIIKSLPVGILVTLFLTFIARPLVTIGLLKPFKSPNNQVAIISWAGLRGASSIVFATVAAVSLTDLNIDVFHIVFCIVILSMLTQGTTLKLVSQKVDMIDPDGNVFKTFNDYSEEINMDFVSTIVDSSSNWVGKKIADIGMPHDILITLIQRDGLDMIPNGETIVEENDEIVLTAVTFNSSMGTDLQEFYIDKKHKWAYLMLSEISVPNDFLVVIIKRKGHTIVPNGDTLILPGDLVVLNTLRNP
ncbi:MAG: potassium/proton antiporter [Peptostreptococcus sp.]|uniref:potassium/proton antiporter n=1 Tax=Peptostreptococcus sp. TaxID=1262 RepID=UPI002FC925A6